MRTKQNTHLGLFIQWIKCRHRWWWGVKIVSPALVSGFLIDRERTFNLARLRPFILHSIVNECRWRRKHHFTEQSSLNNRVLACAWQMYSLLPSTQTTIGDRDHCFCPAYQWELSMHGEHFFSSLYWSLFDRVNREIKVHAGNSQRATTVTVIIFSLSLALPPSLSASSLV